MITFRLYLIYNKILIQYDIDYIQNSNAQWQFNFTFNKK